MISVKKSFQIEDRVQISDSFYDVRIFSKIEAAPYTDAMSVPNYGKRIPMKV